jgi:hypothetical protein
VINHSQQPRTKTHRQLAVFPNLHAPHGPRNNRNPALPRWRRGPVGLYRHDTAYSAHVSIACRLTAIYTMMYQFHQQCGPKAQHRPYRSTGYERPVQRTVARQDRLTTERNILMHSRSSSTPAALTTNQDPLDSESTKTGTHLRPRTVPPMSMAATKISRFFIIFAALRQQDRRLQR